MGVASLLGLLFMAEILLDAFAEIGGQGLENFAPACAEVEVIGHRVP